MAPAPAAPHRHALAPLARPFVRLCLATRLPPAFFTLLSVPLAALAFVLLIRGHVLPAVPVVLFAGGMDAMDGAVARARGTTTAAGGYLDSMIDRLVDLLVLVGIMLAAAETRSFIVGTLALFGTLTTSAAKWRLAQELPQAPRWRDFSRTDRYLLILAGLLTAGLLPAMQQDALYWSLVALAVLTNLSAAWNTWRGWRLLQTA